MATSGSINTGSVGSFYFTFDWYRTGYSSSLNEHYIHYTVTAHNSPGSYRTIYLKDLWIAGVQRYYEAGGSTCYDGTVITSGDITIPSSTSAGDGWFNVYFGAGVGTASGTNCSLEGSWDLDRIPRYTTVWNSERGKTLNSISVNWTTADARDWTQYSLNDGVWTDAYDTVASDQKNGYYTIYNLQPNTTYKVRTRCRRQDSGLWSEASDLYITTYDIAKLTTVPNINHGDNLTVSYTNPSGSSLEISVFKTDGVTPIANYRSCSGSSYTFNFTDEELDRIYKLYGNNNSVTLRVYIKTANNINYLNYKDFTVTLTGNQKTVWTKVDGTYKRGKVFVKVDGVWRKGIIWTKVDGTWVRSI